jgi:hypothetical protein
MRRTRHALLTALLAALPPIVLAADPAPASPAPATAAPAATPAPSPSPAPAEQEKPKSEKPPDTVKDRGVVGKIKGTVYTGGRKPMAGLLVQLSAKDDSGSLRVTGTDEKGEYVFRDLPAGVYEIEVGASGFRGLKKGRIEVRPPFQNLVDFELPVLDATRPAPPLAPGTTLVQPAPPAPRAPDAPAASPAGPMVTVRGTFLDQQRRPIPEVSVTFVSLAGKEAYQAFSGDDGRFNIAAVPAGRYRVLVASPGHVALDLKAVEVSAATGLNLSLSLVDYPLNFKGGEDDLPPREEPRPAPPAP